MVAKWKWWVYDVLTRKTKRGDAMKGLYKFLSMANDFKAIFGGRILQRIWNKLVLKGARKLFK